MDARRLVAWILRAGIVVLFFWMTWAYLIPVVLGGILALLLEPWELRLQVRLRRFGRYAALLVTIGAVVLIVAPLTLIVIKAIGAIQAFLSGDLAGAFASARGFFAEHVAPLADRFGYGARLGTSIDNLVRQTASLLAGYLGGFATSLPGMVLEAFLFLLSLYYFLRDGRTFVSYLYRVSPFTLDDTDALFDTVNGTVRGAILGTIASALVQGILAILALTIFGVPGAFLLGVIATILAVLPMVGTTPVMVGAVLYLFFDGRLGAAIGMLVAALVIGVSDNVVRPWVQSSSSSMHPLLVLVGIFGGVAAFGAAGVFLGPIVVAILEWALGTWARARAADVPEA